MKIPPPHSLPFLLRIYLLSLLILLFLTKSALALTLDLITLYRIARERDPLLKAIQHELNAVRTLPRQTKAQMLPQLNVNYNTYRINYHEAPPRYFDYNSYNFRINLQQTLLNLPLLEEHRQNHLRVTLSEYRLLDAELSLFFRVTDAYFEFLSAQERLRVLKEEERAIRAQKAQIEKLFQAGEATLADLHDAEAKLSDLLYRLAIAERDLFVSNGKLLNLLGESHLPELSIYPLREDEDLTLIPLSDLTYWLSLAEKRNPQVLYYLQNREIAHREIKKQNYQAFPRAEAFASYVKSSSIEYLKTEPISYTMIGLQINLPLFTSGYITAKKEEAREKYHQASRELERILLDVRQKITELYFAVKASQALISSSKASLLASKIALESTKKSYEAGFRTFVDVLQAESNYYRAKLNHLQARIDFITNYTKLKIFSGDFTERDLENINRLLTPGPTHATAKP